MGKKIASAIMNIVLLGVVFFGVLIFSEHMHIPGAYQLLVVQSGSMEPTIKTGSLIFVQPQANYGVGDIVTRKSDFPGLTITHRIVREEMVNGSQVFITQGDANNGDDGENVPPQNILGKEKLAIPYVGYAVNFAKTPKGFFVIIIIPAILVIIDEVLNIKNEMMERKYRKRQKDLEKREAEILRERSEMLRKNHLV